MINYVKIVFLAVTLQEASFQDISWTYRESDRWGDISKICATGQYQSPINLEHNGVWISNDKSPVEFFYHDAQAEKITIQNNGYYVILTGIWQDNVPYITGPIIFDGEVYNFDNVNIHWSTDNNNGTEHSFQGQRYAVELHMAYWNIKYESVNEAVNRPDGFVALCILFDIDDSVGPNPGMQDFASLFGLVRNPGDSSTLPSFDLSAFIPKSLGCWYSYHGSFSTPPCTENLRWVVFSEPQPINTQIITAVRSLNLYENNMPNNRPLQPINNRVVDCHC